VAALLTMDGFMIGSIEGRVGIQYVEDNMKEYPPRARPYAGHCFGA